MAYNTNNPLGSSDPRDLFDNSANFDEGMGSTAESFLDRFGRPRATWQKFHNLTINAESQIGETVTTAKARVNAAADAGIEDIDESVAAVDAAEAAAISQMQETAANLGDDLNNKRYDTYAEMLADPQTRDAVVAVVDGDQDSNLNGWYAWNNTTHAWVRLVNQPAMASVVAQQFEERIVLINPAERLIPLAATESGQVPLWLEEGNLDAAGVTTDFQDKVIAGRVVDFPSESLTGAALPIAVSGGQVVIWLEQGRLAASGLADVLLDQVSSHLDPCPNLSSSRSPVPVATDAATLFRWRAKLADFRYGVSGTKLKVGVAGDSWAEFVRIPNAIRTMIEKSIPNAGEGWQSVSGANKMSGITLTYDGFTLIDGGTVSIGGAPTGIDGMSLSTTTTTATLELANCKFTDLKIYYFDNDATFQYSVDGGSPITVSGSGTNTIKYATVSGLADISHELNITTAGNASTLYILGFYTTRAIGGFELSKMGNSGAYSTFIDQWTGNIQPIAATMDLDLVVIILGTNDQRFTPSTPEKYVEVIGKMVAAYRAATPGVGIVLVCPARTNPAVVIRPLSLYRDALYQFCIDNACEFYSMYDSFGTFEQADALGQFADALHTSDRGSTNLAYELNSRFIKL